MAINIVQKQREPDPIEKLANAVNIIKNVYGMNIDSKNLDLAKQKLESDKKEKKEKGYLTENELATGGYDVKDQPSNGYNKAYILPEGEDKPIEKYIKKPFNGFMDPYGSKELSAEKARLDIEKAKTERDLGSKPTGDQSKAALFAKRMEQAEDVFTKLNDIGSTGATAGAAVQRSGFFPEMFKSETSKLRQQAETNFLNAVLRRESGAAISPSEFESGSTQYFPRVGDTPVVLEQKRQNRALATEGLKGEAGLRALGNIKDVKQKYDADVLDYAKTHGISPEKANEIKIQRGGK